jgi:lipoate-protein ligase A
LTNVDVAWRLLVHAPADGAWNMAVDEALLESYTAAGAAAGPTLRLYGWRPAALSLGRFQRAEGSRDATFLRENGIDLVRRPTGGSAVLHEFERTYAVTAQLRSAPFPGSVLETYRRVAGALCAALRRLGVDAEPHAPGEPGTRRSQDAACFGTPSAHEISVGGRKLVGSAQLRRRGAFLQHGSILLRSDPERLARAIGLDRGPSSYTDLARELGEAPAADVVDGVLAEAFAESFSARLTPGRLTVRETRRATRLRGWKYLSAAWTLEGRDPAAPRSE